jgi:hypothetical protein
MLEKKSKPAEIKTKPTTKSVEVFCIETIAQLAVVRI